MIDVVNEMIALAIREWGRVMNRNHFTKTVDLEQCVRALLMGIGIRETRGSATRSISHNGNNKL